MANVTIYTTPTCTYCKMAKAFFLENEVKYSEKDVSVDMAAQKEMIDKSGQFGVPVIEVDGQIVVGFDKGKLADLLKVKS